MWLPIEDLHLRSVATTCNEQPIGSRVVERSLGLVQTWNRVHLPAGLQIDHFERVIKAVAKRRWPFASTLR